MRGMERFGKIRTVDWAGVDERREKAVAPTQWAHRCHLKPLQFWETRLHGVLGAGGGKCVIEE